MALVNWTKTENEAGYPCYVNNESGKQQYDHPEFCRIIELLQAFDKINYIVYTVAFKIHSLQVQLRVPPLRITSGVFARHQLSLSESSLSLDASELEAVIADMYFAAEKEGLFSGDVDLAVDLVINLLLNVYDRDRKEPIRVLAAKTLLIVLSNAPCSDKWYALANCASDHNGCVSPRRLATLLTYVTAVSAYLKGKDSNIQEDVDACFAKSAGMLGVSVRCVAEWALTGCSSARWLPVLSRIQSIRGQTVASDNCSCCSKSIMQMLKFKCSKCNDVYFCETCYLYDNKTSIVNGHKKTHMVYEIIDGETQPSECLSFMKGVRRFFFCTKTKKKKTVKTKKQSEKSIEKMVESDTTCRKKNGKPAMFTSTVGKASGNGASNPTSVLHDIIMQLENQNRALKDLSEQMQNTNSSEEGLRAKVDLHWTQISTQINRLKMLKENLSTPSQNLPSDVPQTKDKTERLQAFDLFSPIPLVEEVKQSKVSENLKSQPRVLSLDSGNFSVMSKQADHLMTVSGDAMKPVVVHATSDSISTVSMNDISSWYNDTESLAPDKRQQKLQNQQKLPNQTQPDFPSQSLCISEQKFDANLRSVANSNDKMKELNADLDTVLDRLQQILSNNAAMDDSCLDNTQLRETANEMEGLLGTLIRGVEQRVTLNATKDLV